MIAKLKALHYNEYGFHVSKGDMDMKFMKKLLVASLAMVCAFGGAKLTSGTVTTVKAAENENLKSVLSIDAGRKYFQYRAIERPSSKSL